MASSKNKQMGLGTTALELFPRKKRRSRLDAITSHKKKKKTSATKPEPPSKDEESSASDLELENFVHSDSDDADGVEEVVLSIKDKTQIHPTVLHVVKNDLDIVALAYEEVALEGLDGITLEALWTRLQKTTAGNLNGTLRIFVWNKLRNNNLIILYELPEKRNKLEILKRFIEPTDGGYEIDNSSQPQDIYSTESNQLEGVFGACDSVSTRRNITNKAMLLTLQEVEVCYGNKMVLVADEKLRTLQLFTEFHDPDYLNGYSELQYRILERIGRNRTNGELTYGKSCIGQMCRDAKSLFYYRNLMEKANIIVAQPISFGVDGQTQTGSLLQLQRYYKEMKLKKHLVIEYLVNLLKSQPDCMIAYSEFLKRIGLEQWSKLRGKSIMKSPDITTLINRMTLPYRTVYPDARTKDWKKKNRDGEKSIWVLQLKDPTVNLQQFFSKEDPAANDSSDDDDMETLPINSCLPNIAYKVVFEAGPQGINFKDFIKASGIDYYTSRRLLFSLSQRNIIATSKQDVRSQRRKNYVAAHYCRKTANQVVVETMDQAEDCDDDTIDFIANVLQVDSENKHHLKDCAVVDTINSYIHNTETSMGEYEAIKLSRSINNVSADSKVIYENKHAFIKLTSTQSDVSIQLQRPSVPMNSNVRDLFGKTFNQTQSLSRTSAFFNDFVVSSNLDISTEMPSERTICSAVSYYKIREISEFYPVLERLNLLLTKVGRQLNFKIILSKTMKVVNKMLSLKDPALHVSKHCDDDEDLDLVESFSMIVNLDSICDLDEENRDTSNIDSVKEIIINHFEIEDVTLNTYFLNVENKKGEKRSPNILDDNLQPAKRPKLEPNINETSDSEASIIENKKRTLLSHINMGPSPEISILSEYTDCEVKVILSTVPDQYASPTDSFTGVDLTQRVIERSNIIIDYIRFNNIVTDTKLMSHLNAIEKLRGHGVTVDKRTLFGIVSRVITFGYVRAVKLMFKVKKFCRSRMLFFRPNYSIFPYLNSLIEAAIFSLRTYAKRKINFLLSIPNATMHTALPSKHIPSNPNYKSSRIVSYRYGYLQKFSRLQLMHQFIFYLVYGYSGVYKCERADLDTYFEDEDAFKQLPDIYKNEVTWKMFIPPLPQYPDYPEGWSYIADIIMRLPLSIFVRVCSVVYIIPELSDYLNHPVKRHILVKDLPLSIVDAMYCNRRYIDIIYPLFCYMCYMGLMQCGPKSLKNKFDMYVYLNRRAVMYDTTTSEPGYHEVSDKKYEEIQFYFNSEEDITKFWSMIWSISARSKLGYRYSILGKLITLENIHEKQGMVESLTPVIPDAAVERDVGYIPGDMRGACGYDTALWVHIRRNWASNNTAKSSKIREININHDTKQQVAIKEKTVPKIIKPNQSRIRTLTSKQRTVKGKRRFIPEPRLGKKKAQAISRVVKARTEHVVRERTIGDDIDKELQQTYSGARAKFNSTEMLALSVCIEVFKFMKSARQGVSMICVRDFMHRVCKNVLYKKTSSAYRRRLLHIENSVKDLCSSDSFYLKNLNSDDFALKYYTLFLKRVESKRVSEAEIKIAFLYLAYYTLKHYQEGKQNNSFKNYLNTSTVQHAELMDAKTFSNANYINPTTKDDIKRDTLQSLIHSSLSCVINDEIWRGVLLKAFRNYSEDTVRFSVRNMQMIQILSSQRGLPSRQYIDGTLVLMGKSYQLSFVYCFNQITNYPNNIFQNALETVSLVRKEAEQGTTKFFIEPFENNDLLALFEISSITALSYELEQTSAILTINPLISDHTILIKELVRRCGVIIRNIILQSATSNDESMFSNQNVENIISNIINSDSSQSLEGVQLIQNIIENSQYLDKDPDDDNTYSTYDSAPVQSTQTPSEVETSESRNMSIYGLKSLLTKGLFPELDDDAKLEELENHFTPKYPNVWLIPNWSPDVITGIQPYENLSTIIDDIERDAVYNFTTIADNLEVHFNEGDLILVQSLLDFISAKAAFGASIPECYHFYKKFSTTLSFQFIMEELINLKHVLLHGIASLMVIHICFIDYWTNPLDSTTSGSKYVDSKTTDYRVKLMPWMKVDGTIFIDTLENWMSTILSHCLSNPQATVRSIAKRFPYIKPVESYFILKILQRLGCISLKTYETSNVTTLFSESTYINLVPAPYHCDISSLTVTVESCAILKLGQALKDIKMV